MAKIFLKTESNIIGLRFSTGPVFFPGFGRGTNTPSFISDGYWPVSADWLSISEMFSHTMSGLQLYFKR